MTFDAKIDSLNLFIGQQTVITLDVSMGAGQKLEFPPLKKGDQLVPNVEVVDISNADTTKLNAGKTLEIVQRLTITAWDSAFYYLPLLKNVSIGIAISISAVVAAAVMAFLRPIPDEQEEA